MEINQEQWFQLQVIATYWCMEAKQKADEVCEGIYDKAYSAWDGTIKGVSVVREGIQKGEFGIPPLATNPMEWIWRHEVLEGSIRLSMLAMDESRSLAAFIDSSHTGEFKDLVFLPEFSNWPPLKKLKAFRNTAKKIDSMFPEKPEGWEWKWVTGFEHFELLEGNTVLAELSNIDDGFGISILNKKLDCAIILKIVSAKIQELKGGTHD